MRIGFVTCVELGRRVLETALESGHALDVLITLEDHRAVDKSGRIFLDDLSDRYGVPLFKVRHIDEAGPLIRKMEIDWLFIVGWSQIAGAELLNSPTYGALGMHPTLLPEGRGRASIPWAIIKGLETTGVTLFQLDQGVDTGPILEQKRISVSKDETATFLYEKASVAHVDLALEVWPRLIDGTTTSIQQTEANATVWPGRTHDDGALNRQMTVSEVDRLVRATTHPYPGAFINQDDGTRIRVWSGHIGAASGNELNLAFRDGLYAATRYEVEEH